jgi:hypothetical protein
VTKAEFGDAMLQYCAATGGSETSGYRSPERNAKLGGKPTSSHLIGMAQDVGYHPNPVPDIEVAQEIAKKLGLYVHREKRAGRFHHDHVRPIRVYV